MAAKQLAFDSEAQKAILAGVEKLASAVKSTFGPRGRNAVLDKGWGAPNVTKDGVSVAEEIELNDKYENMGAQLVKEAATKTSDVAGDGTTTATVLAEAIYKEGLRSVVAGLDPNGVNREGHFFYGQYYAAQAMWQAGGEHWNQWYPAIVNVLLQTQKSDGSWMDPTSPDYATAMAVITLHMPNNYLPIFQR